MHNNRTLRKIIAKVFLASPAGCTSYYAESSFNSILPLKSETQLVKHSCYTGYSLTIATSFKSPFEFTPTKRRLKRALPSYTIYFVSLVPPTPRPPSLAHCGPSPHIVL